MQKQKKIDMKRAILFVLLLSWSVPAFAISVTAHVNLYSTPVDHLIQINCKVNAGDWAWWVTFDASKTKVTKEMPIKHGSKLQCKVRAKRKSDGKTSEWSPIHYFTYKAKVVAPKKIIKMVVN